MLNESRLRAGNNLTVCAILILHVQLAQTKVAQGNVASVVQKDILRLEITVDDLETMQALQRTEQLGSIETGPVDIEALLALKVMEQLTAVDESKDEVQLLWRLEGEL